MNKVINIITIIFIILSIGIVTSYKVIKNHQNKLLLVEEKYIIEQAHKCYVDKKCLNASVTLKELYDLNYLTKQTNPVTKEYYQDSAYIKKEENGYVFYN